MLKITFQQKGRIKQNKVKNKETKINSNKINTFLLIQFKKNGKVL